MPTCITILSTSAYLLFHHYDFMMPFSYFLLLSLPLRDSPEAMSTCMAAIFPSIGYFLGHYNPFFFAAHHGRLKVYPLNGFKGSALVPLFKTTKAVLFSFKFIQTHFLVTILSSFRVLFGSINNHGISDFLYLPESYFEFIYSVLRRKNLAPKLHLSYPKHYKNLNLSAASNL